MGPGFIGGGAYLGGRNEAMAQMACDAKVGSSEPPLLRDINSIRSALDRLDMVLGVVRDKLSPVTIPQPPSPVDSNACGQIQGARSPYGENLRDQERRILMLADAMEALRERLEV